MKNAEKAQRGDFIMESEGRISASCWQGKEGRFPSARLGPDGGLESADPCEHRKRRLC
jgi:hypothetical protein